MAEPTIAPNIRIKVERNGVHRLMYLSPHPENQADDDPNRITTLRVYHSARHEPWVFKQDLPIATGQGVLETTFTPGVLGAFAFSFVNSLDEEGPLSHAAKFVYANASNLISTLDGLPTVCASGVSGEMVLGLLDDATDEFDRWTQQHFHPRWLVVPIDGHGAYDVNLDVPIIEVHEVRLRSKDQVRILSPDRYRVYNRHVAVRNAFTGADDRPDGYLDSPGDGTGGLLKPDDRLSPLIAFIWPDEIARGARNVHQRGYRATYLSHGGVGVSFARGFYTNEGFGRGRQNIMVAGFFGYTDPDLSTPSGVSIGTELLATRLALLRHGGVDAATEIRNAHRLIMTKVDTHVVMYHKDGSLGHFTRDPIIDDYISAFFRPLEAGGT